MRAAEAPSRRGTRDVEAGPGVAAGRGAALVHYVHHADRLVRAAEAPSRRGTRDVEAETDVAAGLGAEPGACGCRSSRSDGHSSDGPAWRFFFSCLVRGKRAAGVATAREKKRRARALSNAVVALSCASFSPFHDRPARSTTGSDGRLAESWSSHLGARGEGRSRERPSH